MSHAERQYHWTWHLQAAPTELWPLVSNTDRFNRDCGFPEVSMVADNEIKGFRAPDARRLKAQHLGLTIEWDERPFEWVAPHTFGVERIFKTGPFACIRAHCELAPHPQGGTQLTYQTWFTPASLLGQLALLIGAAHVQFRLPFDRVFKHYDQLACAGALESNLIPKPKLARGATARLETIRTALQKLDQGPEEIDQLIQFIVQSDDTSLIRIKPYVLADLWKRDRRHMLQLCLHATRKGLLDFSWDILCPLCRGAKSIVPTLSDVESTVHCDACQIDFTTNLEQSVELTFHPNPALRPTKRIEYCVGGPQITPHIVAQRILQSGSSQTFSLKLKPGRYRVRTKPAASSHFIRVSEAGPDELTILLSESSPDDLKLSPRASLKIENDTAAKCGLVVEHLGWTDQAATAREVTVLQTFRDLFSKEVLRPGEQISVGSLTLVFTDIKGSTHLYRNIGDAPAFGHVLNHFAVLRQCVREEGGAIIKTMGDAIMAAFPQPIPALNAMRKAQHQLLASPTGISIELKVGLHHGPCLAINQNDQLDYFGSTVNLASRLGDLSNGSDIILSDSVRRDPEVSLYLQGISDSDALQSDTVQVKGFDEETFAIWRLHEVSR